MMHSKDSDLSFYSADPRRLQKYFTNFIFILAILIGTLITFISIHQFNNLIKANRLVAHTYQVILAAHEAQLSITLLEAQQRGYLAFGDVNFAADMDKELIQIKTAVNNLIVLTHDNPSQNSKAKALATMVLQRVELLRQMVGHKDKNQLNTPAVISLFHKSQLLSNEIRLLTNEIVQIEFILLSERSNKAVTRAYYTNLIFVIGQALSIFFLLLAFILFNRELIRREKAEEKMGNIEGEIRSLIEGANDMIAALDNNYRFIIFNNAYSREFQRLFGKKISIGDQLTEILTDHHVEKSKLIELWDESLQGKEYVKNVELHDGEETNVFEVTSSLIKNNQDQVIGAVHISRNVTERIEKNRFLNDGLIELRDKNEKITLLLEMSDIMLACNSSEELSEIIAKYCRRILNFARGIFYIMHPSKNFLEMSATWLDPTCKVHSFVQDECWALRLGHIHIAGSSGKELICQHAKENSQDSFSYMCVPLRAQNDIYGLMYIEVPKSNTKEILNENERIIVNAFAELAALALANVRLRENLSFQSMRDPLTTLYNRRYLEEFLLKLIHQSERNHAPIAVLMLDLDHFKRVNDIHGHDAGDAVLKEMSRVLLEDIRPGDFAARYGGEEFVIVLFNTDLETGYVRAENIRKSISIMRIKFGAQEAGGITASIGLAVYPQDGNDVAELIENADKALYVAKNKGRDKVITYDSIKEIENLTT